MTVRKLFLEGRGINSSVAIYQDVSGIFFAEQIKKIFQWYSICNVIICRKSSWESICTWCRYWFWIPLRNNLWKGSVQRLDRRTWSPHGCYLWNLFGTIWGVTSKWWGSFFLGRGETKKKKKGIQKLYSQLLLGTIYLCINMTYKEFWTYS